MLQLMSAGITGRLFGGNLQAMESVHLKANGRPFTFES